MLREPKYAVGTKIFTVNKTTHNVIEELVTSIEMVVKLHTIEIFYITPTHRYDESYIHLTYNDALEAKIRAEIDDATIKRDIQEDRITKLTTRLFQLIN